MHCYRYKSCSNSCNSHNRFRDNGTGANTKSISTKIWQNDYRSNFWSSKAFSSDEVYMFVHWLIQCKTFWRFSVAMGLILSSITYLHRVHIICWHCCYTSDHLFFLLQGLYFYIQNVILELTIQLVRNYTSYWYPCFQQYGIMSWCGKRGYLDTRRL